MIDQANKSWILGLTPSFSAIWTIPRRIRLIVSFILSQNVEARHPAWGFWISEGCRKSSALNGLSMPTGSGSECAESLDLCKTRMLGLSICFFLATRSAKARRWQSPEGVSETDAEGSRENKEAQRFTKTMMTHWFSHSVFCAFLCLLVAEIQSFNSFPERRAWV
jgi:hypothetical protein